MKFENTEVFNFEGAFRGMRNPMNSWEKSDSDFSGTCHAPGTIQPFDCSACNFYKGFGQPCKPLIGPKDMELARKLIHGGSEHRKFLRQIFVSVDITAPLYWWKEFETYKVGTTSNSCSTMHKIAEKEFKLDDFSHDHLTEGALGVLEKTVEVLNMAREAYLAYDEIMQGKKDEKYVSGIASKKDLWWQMIQLLPSSYNQKRTITMTYENLFAMCHQRKNHKLDEWSADDGSFLAWARTLPYAEQLIFDE